MTEEAGRRVAPLFAWLAIVVFFLGLALIVATTAGRRQPPPGRPADARSRS